MCGMVSAGSCEGLFLLRRLLSPSHVVKCRRHHALECSKLLPPNPHPVFVGGMQEEDKKLRSYESLFDESKMTSNAEVAATEDASASIAFEDDFMVRKGGSLLTKISTKPHRERGRPLAIAHIEIIKERMLFSDHQVLFRLFPRRSQYL